MQLRHVVWYELGFCHMFNLDWSKGRASFAKLERDNDWSRAFYAYMQAVSTNRPAMCGKNRWWCHSVGCWACRRVRYKKATLKALPPSWHECRSTSPKSS